MNDHYNDALTFTSFQVSDQSNNRVNQHMKGGEKKRGKEKVTKQGKGKKDDANKDGNCPIFLKSTYH